MSALASDWVDGLGYKARLLMGNKQEDGSYHAALDLKLEKDYLTYWRSPGGYGIAPSLNFEKSENISKTTIHWPSPHVFKKQGSYVIGYKNRLVVPLTLIPEKADEDIKLTLEAFLGVCAEICVPVDISLNLDFSTASASPESRHLIASSFKTVPLVTGAEKLLPKAIKLIKKDDKEHISVRLKLPEGAEKVTLLAEGPQDWYFSPLVSAPNELEAHEDYSIAHLPLFRDFPEDVIKQEAIRLTVIVDGQQAVERIMPLKINAAE